MRYQILKPPSPIDLRSQAFNSLDALQIIAPPLDDECESEEAAVAVVRQHIPDAIGFPITVNVGSGRIVMIGVVDDATDRDGASDDVIPFRMFVRAIPDHGRDRMRIQQNAHFDQKRWRPSIHRPVLVGSMLIRFSPKGANP